jgi:hypothetical protein
MPETLASSDQARWSPATPTARRARCAVTSRVIEEFQRHRTPRGGARGRAAAATGESPASRPAMNRPRAPGPNRTAAIPTEAPCTTRAVTTPRGDTPMKTTPTPRGSLRRTVLRTAAITVAVLLPGAWTATTQAQDLPRPKGPITINIVDVAGDLALTQGVRALRQAESGVVSVAFTRRRRRNCPGGLKATTGHNDIDMVLTGVGFLGNAVEQGLLIKLLPTRGKITTRWRTPAAGRRSGQRRARASRSCSCRPARCSVQPGQRSSSRRRRRRTAGRCK